MKEYLDNLVAERNRAWNEANALTEEASKRDDKRMSAEENAKWERIAGADPNSVLNTLDEQIRSMSERLQRDKEGDAVRETIAPLVQERIDRNDNESPTREKVEFDQVQQWRLHGGDLSIDIAPAARLKSFIRDGMSPAEARDLLKVTGSAGGNTVPTSLATLLYDFLEVFSGVRRAGITVLQKSTGENFNWPKVASHGTATIVGEGSAIAENDPTFGQAAFVFYKYGQVLQVSSELLTDTVVDLRPFIAKDMGRGIVRAVENDWLNGSGSNVATGALTVMGTAATIQTGSTGVPSYANLVDTAYSVNEEYQQLGVGWLMRFQMAGAIRKIVDTTGRPIWQPSLILGQPDTLLGYPVYYAPQMGAVGTAGSTAIAFGHWPAYYAAEVGTVNLQASTDFAFTSDLTTYRTTYRAAGNLIDLTGAVKKVLEPTT